MILKDFAHLVECGSVSKGVRGDEVHAELLVPIWRRKDIGLVWPAHNVKSMWVSIVLLGYPVTKAALHFSGRYAILVSQTTQRKRGVVFIWSTSMGPLYLFFWSKSRRPWREESEMKDGEAGLYPHLSSRRVGVHTSGTVFIG